MSENSQQRPPVPPLLLTVSFDAQQVSSRLDWSITPRSEQPDNRNAGQLLFHKGQHLGLEVIGYGSAESGFCGFKLVDCCIMTRPQLVRIGHKQAPLFAHPSMFKGVEGATYQLPLDFTDGQQPGPGADPRQFVKNWDHCLEVAEREGRWELSFMLTVHLHGVPDKQARRVFYFDPESQVGDGTMPPMDDCDNS